MTINQHSPLHDIRKARCRHSWDSMAGSESVRHCGVCGQNVYQTIGLDEQQLLEVIASAESLEDGKQLRFFRRKDGRIMLAPGFGELTRPAKFALSTVVAGTWFSVTHLPVSLLIQAVGGNPVKVSTWAVIYFIAGALAGPILMTGAFSKTKVALVGGLMVPVTYAMFGLLWYVLGWDVPSIVEGVTTAFWLWVFVTVPSNIIAAYGLAKINQVIRGLPKQGEAKNDPSLVVLTLNPELEEPINDQK